MIYKRLGRTDYEISRLGFGAMRLPSREDGAPDVDASVAMIHRAFELGINYIDSAVMYCRNQSESIVGQALRGWAGGRIFVSTKNHYMGNDEKAWRANLDNSLSGLGVDAIDVYNIHGISWEKWETWVKGSHGILSWMKKARDEGVIRHIACSFHDSPEALLKIVETGEFSSITLQYNLLYRDLEPVFPDIAARDVGIVVMGPVGGGRLREPSESLKGIVGHARSTPEVALRFVLTNPHVTAAISGMGTCEMVEENCATAARAEALSDGERTQISGALDRLKELANLYCTGCNYCMPCPSGVDIPANFLAMNTARVYGLEEHARAQYKHIGGKASYCIACGECEPACPQDIPIRDQLREVAARFDPAYGTMMLSLVPVRRDDSGIRMQALFHNVSDQGGKARVGLRSTATTIEPAEIEMEIDEPFQSRGVAVRVAAGGARQDVLNVDARVEDAAGTREEVLVFVFGTCAVAESIDELRASADPATVLGFDWEDQVHLRDDTAEPLPAVTARAGRALEAFLFHARISASEIGGADNGPVPRVDVMLDLRNRKRLHAPGFGDRMCWIRLFPAAAADEERVRVVRGTVKVEDLQVTGRDERGEIGLRILWTALNASAPSPGDAFGFDWIYERTDPTEERRLRLVWSGNRTVHRDGRLGTLFCA